MFYKRYNVSIKFFNKVSETLVSFTVDFQVKIIYKMKINITETGVDALNKDWNNNNNNNFIVKSFTNPY